MKEKEIWKKHNSGLLVSNLGQVFVPKSGSNKEHNTYGYLDNTGYLKIGYKYKLYLVHRLVAECFIPNPDNLSEVNHKNEDKTNNKAENLEWCDRKYNINYGTRTEKISKTVLQYDLNGNFIKEWVSIHEIGRQLGYFQGDISHACIHNHKSHKYIWRYKNQET